MKPGLFVPTVEPGDDWRAVLALAGYRTVVGFALMAVVALGHTVALFHASLPDAFRIICLLYLAQAVALLIAGLARRPVLRIHIAAHVAIDVAAFTLLTYTGAGVASGLGMLLIPPIAASGVVLSPRISALLAACGAQGMIYQEVLRSWRFDASPADFVQAGILGALYFGAVALAQWLSNRVRVSEAIAADRAIEVRDLAELNRRIIDRMQIGALVVNSQGVIQTINRAALNLLGCPDRRPVRLARLSPALAGVLHDWRSGARPNPSLLRYEGRALLPSFVRLDTADDAPALVFLEDMQRQNEQAQQIKLASLGQLTASIAHEIRNPLGAISHASQLLAESEQLAAEDTRLLEMVHRHTRRIDAIISSVLGLSRRSSEGRTRLSLATWLADTIADYRDTRADPPRFEFAASTFDHYIAFDPGHLRQLLFNLWDNSDRHARHGQQSPRISLSCELTSDGELAMDVRDDGPGLDPAIAEHVLEPFFTTAGDGTGLGLHIARELCDANGARLLVLAQKPGACFRIVFALSDEAVPDTHMRSTDIG